MDNIDPISTDISQNTDQNLERILVEHTLDISKDHQHPTDAIRRSGGQGEQGEPPELEVGKLYTLHRTILEDEPFQPEVLRSEGKRGWWLSDSKAGPGMPIPTPTPLLLLAFLGKHVSTPLEGSNDGWTRYRMAMHHPEVGPCEVVAVIDWVARPGLAGALGLGRRLEERQLHDGTRIWCASWVIYEWHDGIRSCSGRGRRDKGVAGRA